MSRLKRWLVKPFHFLTLLNPTLFFAAIALILLFIFSGLALRHIHSSQERIIREHLQASLGSFSELINNWQQQNIAAIQVLANSSQGKQLLHQILQDAGEDPASQTALREWLYPILLVMGFDGYSVINRERIIMAASTESYRRQPVQLPETHEVLDKALARRPAISRPVAAVRPLDGPRGHHPTGTLMQNLCVVISDDDADIGYFCLRFNTQTSFFPIFLKGWTGRSGDIYAIDQHARFITPARFGKKAQSASTPDEQRNARIGRLVSVPDQKNGAARLTYMADFLINHEAGLIRTDYLDYRAVPVAGAGRWIPEMELGVIVEQDLDEAMAPYIASRNIIISLTAGAMLLIMVLTFSALANRKKLESINQNLEELVSERTRELILAKDAALAASQSKAKFLANMSHEIRTPLNAIIGLAHVALGSNYPDRQQAIYLDKIRGSGEHLLEIINDILNLSRMEAGKLELDRRVFTLEQVIDKTLDLVWEKAAAKGLEIKVDIDQDIPKVLVGDPLRLGQILINLCANAVKFTDAGHVSLVVSALRQWDTGLELLMEVKDTGVGIEPEKVDQLFQPFQQVDASSARRFEGTGLGLSICKHLVELMQGRIEVETHPGEGSNFHVFVNLEKNLNPEASVQAAPLAKARLTRFETLSCNLLVVEDNPLNQEIIESLLETMGVKPHCVDSGPAAIQAITQNDFDIVLMDIQLPGMDGVEATRRIRQLPNAKKLPIIAVTANALPGDRESYLAAGMTDYLAKPIDPTQLYNLIKRWSKPARLKASPATEKNQLTILQSGGVDTQGALHNLMDNEALYKRLLERFARERADFPDQLIGFLNRDLPTALNQVHSLKSLAASLGMLRLESIAARVEQQLLVSKPEDSWIEKLNAELSAMIALVTSALNLDE
jgi:signal transduction histidine kinase/DNA-binding response OmpR family regulator